ncbi:MAG: hypothetical protein JNK94_08560 [Hyphomonadaceae bacterium]|nr:hypothetical protein [Hyphomonadaceae bacterium]MBX3509638.1 hypothetical protein [Hyphomonadaceae bacterium]
MMMRWAIAAAVLGLAACASAPPPQSERAPPPPTAAAPTPPLQAAPAPAPAQTPSASASDSGDITIPGQVEQQVPAPRGDPRTQAQLMEDIRNWDTCVMQVQSQASSNPTRPALDSPEDYCAQALGQSNRTAVPARRLEQRR